MLFKVSLLRGCKANDDLCIATDGQLEPPPKEYGTWVMVSSLRAIALPSKL